MKTAVVLCCLLAVAIASDVEWESFKSKFGRRYKSPTEEAFRKKIFLNNKMHVDQQNQRHAEGKATFTMAINQFADLTTQEFSERFNGYKMAQRSEEHVKDLPTSTASTVDWTTSGCITGVKDQGQCGSCWSFSATGSTEFYRCRAGLGLTSLSEQNLVDCSYSYGNLGCNGGLMDSAFQYIIDNGIESEAAYPYTATSQIGNCNFKPALSVASLSGFTDVRSGSEAQLQSAVDGGVVSVAIDASHLSFQLYNSGVYDEPLCSSTQLDHGVLAAGYGTAIAGGDYWLVKNSWGPSWGISGYIWMSRNSNNQCGIATQASYPKV